MIELFYQDPRDGQLVFEKVFETQEALTTYLGSIYHDAHARSMRAFDGGEEIKLSN